MMNSANSCVWLGSWSSKASTSPSSNFFDLDRFLVFRQNHLFYSVEIRIHMLKSMEYNHHKFPTALLIFSSIFLQMEAKKQSFLKLRFVGTKFDIFNAQKNNVVYPLVEWHILETKTMMVLGTWSNNMTRCDSTSYAISWKSFKDVFRLQLCST